MASFDYDVVTIGSRFGGSVAGAAYDGQAPSEGVMEVPQALEDEDVPEVPWDGVEPLANARGAVVRDPEDLALDDALILARAAPTRLARRLGGTRRYRPRPFRRLRESRTGARAENQSPWYESHPRTTTSCAPFVVARIHASTDSTTPTQAQEPSMSTIDLHQRTTLTPDHTSPASPTSAPGGRKSSATAPTTTSRFTPLGPTHVDVTQGCGGVWERLHYDWSDPNRSSSPPPIKHVGRTIRLHLHLHAAAEPSNEVDVIIVREAKNVKGDSSRSCSAPWKRACWGRRSQ